MFVQQNKTADTAVSAALKNDRLETGHKNNNPRSHLVQAFCHAAIVIEIGLAIGGWSLMIWQIAFAMGGNA